MTGVQTRPRQLGGFTPRAHPALGMRATLRFGLALTLTIAYLAFAVSVSHVWRGELEAAVWPVTAWVISILMAYVPAPQATAVMSSRRGPDGVRTSTPGGAFRS